MVNAGRASLLHGVYLSHCMHSPFHHEGRSESKYLVTYCCNESQNPAGDISPAGNMEGLDEAVIHSACCIPNFLSLCRAGNLTA